MFFPMLFERIWMLSSLCCCITVFTLHMYASSVGTSACTKNANISAFLFNHTTLDGHFDLLDHRQHPSRDHVVFWIVSFEPHLFHKHPAGSSCIVVSLRALRCHPLVPTLFLSVSSCLYSKLWADSKVVARKFHRTDCEGSANPIFLRAFCI